MNLEARDARWGSGSLDFLLLRSGGDEEFQARLAGEGITVGGIARHLEPFAFGIGGLVDGDFATSGRGIDHLAAIDKLNEVPHLVVVGADRWQGRCVCG